MARSFCFLSKELAAKYANFRRRVDADSDNVAFDADDFERNTQIRGRIFFLIRGVTKLTW